ncbi:hypothetical protein HMPREF0322_03452 [Desulfitobacterium hafniense DP7]|uniref:Uncharacterized protein n=1 Tax=Desulfitobacterium hafniense DP7 TaxID=537010 RepID=G9XR54_DESHA|nr:hypothetical protein HMPREF0322_03452 [Desulfitobacterium hafniense DP7]
MKLNLQLTGGRKNGEFSLFYRKNRETFNEGPYLQQIFSPCSGSIYPLIV